MKSPILKLVEIVRKTRLPDEERRLREVEKQGRKQHEEKRDEFTTEVLKAKPGMYGGICVKDYARGLCSTVRDADNHVLGGFSTTVRDYPVTRPIWGGVILPEIIGRF